MPGQTRDKEATRQALLDAGRIAFAELGFEGARAPGAASRKGSTPTRIPGRRPTRSRRWSS